MADDENLQKRKEVIADAIAYLKRRGKQVPTLDYVFSTSRKNKYKRGSWDTERRIRACEKERKTISEWAEIWNIRYSSCYSFIKKYNLPFAE